MKLVVLNDDRCDNENLKCEHGLSFYIEQDDLKILFDAGQTDNYINNAKKLGVNLSDVNYIILSHGDYDHGNGLKYFDKKVSLICHPDCFISRVSIRTGNNAGLNQTRLEMANKFDLIENKTKYKISDNIYYLGEIDRNICVDSKHISVRNIDGSENQQLDDSGIVIKTNKGLVVISGCAHSGICNIIEFSKQITNEDKVYAVVGGFHLKHIDETCQKTFDYFKKNNIKKIFPCHCNSDEICDEFKRLFKEQTTILKSGMEIEI